MCLILATKPPIASLDSGESRNPEAGLGLPQSIILPIPNPLSASLRLRAFALNCPILAAHHPIDNS